LRHEQLQTIPSSRFTLDNASFNSLSPLHIPSPPRTASACDRFRLPRPEKTAKISLEEII